MSNKLSIFFRKRSYKGRGAEACKNNGCGYF